MSDNSKNAGCTVPVLGLLGVAFVVLRLCNVIQWSWAWVTLPFWGPFAAVFAAIVVVWIYHGIISILTVPEFGSSEEGGL